MTFKRFLKKRYRVVWTGCAKILNVNSDGLLGTHGLLVSRERGESLA